MKVKNMKKRDLLVFLLLLMLFFCILGICSGQVPKSSTDVNQQFDPLLSSSPNSLLTIKECPEDRPILNPETQECTLQYCTEEDYTNKKCIVSNSVIKKQWINEFLYSTEERSPIYSSFGRNSDGDIYFESSLGNPYSQKKIFTLKSDGREYIDGLRRNEINLDSNLYGTKGNGVIVEINGHKCYLKLSNYESVEMYDFDDKKYTSTKLQDILGYKIESTKNSLLITLKYNMIFK